MLIMMNQFLDLGKAKKEEINFLKIANSLQEQAKAFGFDINAITEKQVKTEKEKVRVLKEQKDIYERIKLIFPRPKVSAPDGPASAVEPTIVVKP